MNPSNRLSRRTALKGIGGAVGAASVGGLALLASGPAAAATSNYGSTTITSDDGTVEYVAIHGDSTVEWSGFEWEAQSVDVDVDARVVDGDTGWVDLYETIADLTADSWGGTNEDHSGTGTSGTISQGIGLDGDGNHDETTDWHIVGSDPDDYGIPNNSIDPSALEVDTDGESSTYTVEVRATYTWHGSSEGQTFEEDFTGDVSVTVENIEEGATATDGDNSGVSGA